MRANEARPPGESVKFKAELVLMKRPRKYRGRFMITLVLHLHRFKLCREAGPNNSVRV